MTPAERLRRWLDTVADSIPTTEAGRHKPRPGFTPAPEHLVPMLRDVILPALEDADEVLLDMTEERDMWRARCDDLERGAAA